MVGAFKAVLTIFYQLYTIHVLVGNKKTQILPSVYALMTNKSEESYERLFQDIIVFSEENEIELSTPVILADLELAVISATKSEYLNVSKKVCFFHLSLCVWRKIQECGIATQYDTDEEFSLF